MTTPHARFSIWRFLLQVAGQLTLLLVLFRFLAPSTWSRQINAGPGPIIIAFLSVHLFNCFFEWGFHRYVLHSVFHRWLIRFSRGHRHHHALTPIRLDRVPGHPDRVVLNRYPITDETQYEDAAFPSYALLVFWILFSPLLLVAQLVLPQAPVLLGGYPAITWSMIAYEVFHAIEHYPYEWWQRAVEYTAGDEHTMGDPTWKKITAWIWKKIYGFHHFHHANIGWNEAISGFFGLPVADWVFGTYHQPKDLLLEGRVATIKEFNPTRRTWPVITWLDDWVQRRESAIRHRATSDSC